MIKTVAVITSVELKPTQSGKTITIIRDKNGQDYSTFSEKLTREAQELEGKTAVIGYDQVQRGQYLNRNAKFLALAEENQVPSGGSGGSVQGPDAAHAPAGPASGTTPGVGASIGDDWLQVVTRAANNGEWRAAEALLRRKDINRSVALKGALDFLQHLKEEDRTPTNLEYVFHRLLTILG